MKTIFNYLVLLTLALPLVAHAKKQAVLIGGGPTPDESQISIEYNTKWVLKIIRQHYTESELNVFYTDGYSPGLDAYKVLNKNDPDDSTILISRIFNKKNISDFQFYSSDIGYQHTSSTLSNVESVLTEIVSTLKKDDELLFVYQGHGGYNSENTNNNSLRLWQEDNLTVTELEQILSNADDGSTIRYILPQCFSGAFARLIYKDAQPDNGLSVTSRCGFLAQTEYLESEGCTPSVNTDSYRDYSYYFFAALSGKYITGDLLDIHSDLNNDNRVTLREAHLFTLANAFSVDYSISTSEYYLKRWQPWYLKWLPLLFSATDNEYFDISRIIARRFDISDDDNRIIEQTSERLEKLKPETASLKEKQIDLTKRISLSQKFLREHLQLKWPQLEHPYSKAYITLVHNDINIINDYVNGLTEYQQLVILQNELTKLKTTALNKQREMVQMEKILHMRNLGRILNNFKKYAGTKEKYEYHKLLTCEDSTL